MIPSNAVLVCGVSEIIEYTANKINKYRQVTACIKVNNATSRNKAVPRVPEEFLQEIFI